MTTSARRLEPFRSFFWSGFEQSEATVAPLIPSIVKGIHEAFSIALASTFWVGIVGAVIAAAFVLFLHEEPMRDTFEFAEASPAPGS